MLVNKFSDIANTSTLVSASDPPVIPVGLVCRMSRLRLMQWTHTQHVTYYILAVLQGSTCSHALFPGEIWDHGSIFTATRQIKHAPRGFHPTGGHLQRIHTYGHIVLDQLIQAQGGVCLYFWHEVCQSSADLSLYERCWQSSGDRKHTGLHNTMS